MRMPRFSYSHTEMGVLDCSSLNMKLIGGRRTIGGLVIGIQRECMGAIWHLFLRRGLRRVSNGVRQRSSENLPPRPVMV